MKTHRIAPDVLAVLKRIRVEGNITKLPNERLANYKQVNQVLEILGGTWNRKAQGHVFEEDPTEVLSDAIATGELLKPIDFKKLFQFYPTPASLAERMVKLARIGPKHTVLEPSAGDGAIITAIHAKHAELKRVYFYEIQKDFANGIVKKFTDFVDWVGGDFLASVPSFRQYDRIVANPPFTRGQDMAHVLHMYSLLKPKGRLVTLTAPGWTFRTDKRALEFRKFIASTGAVQEEIPEGTFKDTNIRTILLTIDK